MSMVQVENDTLRARLRKMRDESKQTTQSAIGVAVTAASAYGIKVFEHRYPDKATVFGMPISLVVGLAGVVVGAGEMLGDKDTNALALDVGEGCLAAYAAEKGAQKGSDLKTAADQKAAAAPAAL